MSTAKTETVEQRERRLERQKGYNLKRRGSPRPRVRKSLEEYNIERVVYMRKWRYGLTPQQWELLFTSQGSCCAICNTSTPNRGKGWVVDHDHKTGQVRGILCSTCNLAMGVFSDDPDLLNRAVTYLHTTPVVEAFVRSGTGRRDSKGSRQGRGPRMTTEQIEELFRLRDEGLTHVEIAERLGFTVSAIGSRVRKLSRSVHGA